MKIFKSIIYTLSQYKFPLLLKYCIIGMTPFLLFTYFSAAFLTNSFNILTLNEDIKIGLVSFLGFVTVIVTIVSALHADK